VTLDERKARAIEDMFREGHGLDLISEMGVHHGWTRDEARSVVGAKGWALDWAGRLQSRHLSPDKRRMVINNDIDHMLAVGIDHELIQIRRLAAKAQNAVDALRRALLHQEAVDAEEAALARKREAEHAAELGDPATWEHGTWGSFLRHGQYGVPVCDACEAAAAEHRQEAHDRRVGICNRAGQPARSRSA
jgi:hypothetical protein